MRNVAIILSLSLLAACNQTTTGKEFSTSAASEIQIGKSTKAFVEGRLGKPESINSQANGEATWTYDYAKLDTGSTGGKVAGTMGLTAAGQIVGSTLPIPGLAMIPALVGAAAMNSSGTEVKTDKNTLTIKFNKKNLVTHCALNIVSTTHTTKGGMFLTPATFDQKQSTAETNCTDLPKEQPQPTAVAAASPSVN